MFICCLVILRNRMSPSTLDYLAVFPGNCTSKHFHTGAHTHTRARAHVQSSVYTHAYSLYINGRFIGPIYYSGGNGRNKTRVWRTQNTSLHPPFLLIK